MKKKQYEDKKFKTPPLRQAGQSANEQYQKINMRISDILLPTLMALVCIWILIILQIIGINLDYIQYLAIAVIITLISYLKVRGIYKDLYCWKRGRDGEIIVGQELEKLRKDNYFAFHDIIIKNKDCNIDHIVVANSGIFVIETKAKAKTKGHYKVIGLDIKNDKVKFSTGKYDTKSLPQLKANMDWFNKQLYLITKEKYKTYGLLTYVEWYVNPDLPKIDDICIINHNNIVKFIRNSPQKFDSNQVEWLKEKIEEYLRDSS